MISFSDYQLHDDQFGGDQFGDDQFGGDHFGDDQFGGDQFGDDQSGVLKLDYTSEFLEHSDVPAVP